eukprot:CAMPEP_0119037302 /NCGR_PEP_ID=MMETSP1177-20130426/5580_1 /TAXON_ID=2985 /ORGANISM="Ochromonas sp, Strain CCMP1899" /LENGTH=101 /DNA_ID=CAMNT_0006998383 /DNA_START=1689 /DNA_END=1994 /DNA_ORIENTATION=+
MVFVCMAENPGALKDNHPKEFEALTAAWYAFHPELVTWVIPTAIHSGHSTRMPQGVSTEQAPHSYSPPQPYETYNEPLHKTGSQSITPSAPSAHFNPNSYN